MFVVVCMLTCMITFTPGAACAGCSCSNVPLRTMGMSAFVENDGQVGSEEISYYSTCRGFSLGLGKSAVFLAASSEKGSACVKQTFENSNNVEPVGSKMLDEMANFIIGKDESLWKMNVHSYSTVRYDGIYEGIDLVYTISEGRAKYDIIVSPGADPSIIAMRYEGADSVFVDDSGMLGLRTRAGVIYDDAPYAYQTTNGENIAVSARFALSCSDNVVRFEIGKYDENRELVIDPHFNWSSYYGGAGDDSFNAVATDVAGNVYYAGTTTSLNFPVSGGAFDTGYNANIDTVVVKVNPTCGAVVYSTYIGGMGNDVANGLAVDDIGRAYVVGTTNSTDFPTTPGAIMAALSGVGDAFVLRLESNGSALNYSTYLGGELLEDGRGIALDGAYCAFVTGSTTSAAFPFTASAYDKTRGGAMDAFVAKLAPDGRSLVYGTFLGGDSLEVGNAIAVDAVGCAYVTGYSTSTNFPTTAGAYKTNEIGGKDGFLTKFNAAGSGLVYSTHLGGTLDDVPNAVVLDASECAFVAGTTNSVDFPITAGAIDTTTVGNEAFVMKFNPFGKDIFFSTMLGGNSDDQLNGIALDANGHAILVGSTNSTDFPTSSNAFDNSANGGRDIFVVRLGVWGNELEYSSYVGGSGDDDGLGIAVKYGGIYIAGSTNSLDFPTIAGLDSTPNGGKDALLTKLMNPLDIPAPQLAAHGQNGTVVLAWNATAIAGMSILGFELYKSTDASTFEYVGYFANASGTVDTNVTNGQIYYYRVVAVYSNGSSPYSDVVSAMPDVLAYTLVPFINVLFDYVAQLLGANSTQAALIYELNENMSALSELISSCQSYSEGVNATLSDLLYQSFANITILWQETLFHDENITALWDALFDSSGNITSNSENITNMWNAIIAQSQEILSLDVNASAMNASIVLLWSEFYDALLRIDEISNMTNSTSLGENITNLWHASYEHGDAITALDITTVSINASLSLLWNEYSSAMQQISEFMNVSFTDNMTSLWVAISALGGNISSLDSMMAFVDASLALLWSEYSTTVSEFERLNASTTEDIASMWQSILSHDYAISRMNAFDVMLNNSLNQLRGDYMRLSRYVSELCNITNSHEENITLLLHRQYLQELQIDELLDRIDKLEAANGMFQAWAEEQNSTSAELSNDIDRLDSRANDSEMQTEGNLNRIIGDEEDARWIIGIFGALLGVLFGIGIVIGYMAYRNSNRLEKRLKAIERSITSGRGKSSPKPPATEVQSTEEVPVAPPVPAPVEKNIIPQKSTKMMVCSVCKGAIKPEVTILTCKCGRSFHESCALRIEECPMCSRKF